MSPTSSQKLTIFSVQIKAFKHHERQRAVNIHSPFIERVGDVLADEAIDVDGEVTVEATVNGMAGPVLADDVETVAAAADELVPPTGRI